MQLSYDEGFNFAIGLFSRRADDVVLDDSYFSFELEMQRDYFNESGGRDKETKQFSLHKCTEEELGVTGTNSKFYPINESDKIQVEKHLSSFYCIDDYESLLIYGARSSNEK